MLEDADFRRALLADVRDRQVHDWWRTFYDALDRRFQLEIINPVQTKTYKFAANLVALAIGRQAGLAPARRRHVALLVDEFHALPAADFPALLAELAKFGASLTLATQTLALVAVGSDQELLHAVFGNPARQPASKLFEGVPALATEADASALLRLAPPQPAVRALLAGQRSVTLPPQDAALVYDAAESISRALGEPFPLQFAPVRCTRGRALQFERVALGAGLAGPTQALPTLPLQGEARGRHVRCGLAIEASVSVPLHRAAKACPMQLPRSK